MKRIIFIIAAILSIAACRSFNPETVADATDEEVALVEPLSWWTGMKMPLQLLIKGDSIADYNVDICGGNGLKIKEIHKADSKNYLFVDVLVSKTAEAGTYYLVFSKDGRKFKYPYRIESREEGSKNRESFSNADMGYIWFSQTGLQMETLQTTIRKTL